MANIYNAIDTSALNERCRIDLLDCVAQLERHCETLPKKDVTVALKTLPSVTFRTTASHIAKKSHVLDASAMLTYATEKAVNQERTMQAARSTYFKKHNPKFEGALPRTEPFRETRNRNELSDQERDFVHRYTEAKLGVPLERGVCDSVPTQVATKAYTEAFCKYKGREPTEKELEEVCRLWFAFAEDGTVGTINKPHFHGPHTHVSICNRRPVRCSNQVYKPELPPVRAARDRFPGPIPVWSSTQNTYTMVSGDTYIPGLHNVSKFGTSAS